MSVSLLNVLKQKSKSFTQSEAPWVQFIKDHRLYILEYSNKVALNINKLNMYRYRPKNLLGEYNIANADIWIILLINNIPLSSGIPFHVNSMWIPPVEIVEDLRVKYIAHQALLSV